MQVHLSFHWLQLGFGPLTMPLAHMSTKYVLQIFTNGWQIRSWPTLKMSRATAEC